ncbi:hypothetical protein AAF134_12285 [Synechococcus lacustris Tous-12m]
MQKQRWCEPALSAGPKPGWTPGATPGGAAQLGGSADRRLLEEALAWADCCLIGAGSLRAHRSSCVIHQPDLLQQRLSQAKPSQPPLIVVSRSCTPLGFDLDWPFWQQPFSRWLLAPFETNPEPLPDGFERLLRLGPWAGLKQQLAAEGLKQVLLLGGSVGGCPVAGGSGG